MDCTKCDRPIEGDVYANAIAIAHRGWIEDVAHFECVDDPAGLPPEEFPKYAAWWMNREREQREAFQDYATDSLALIHRALRTLPHHLNHAYVDQIYGEPEASAQELGLAAGCCTSCGRPVFYTGERDQDCKPVLVGHASTCSTLQAA